MTGYRAIFQAVDSWFFSDGRPFNQDDDGLTEARGQFPPNPHVTASALRNILARLIGGWDTDILGDGLWDLGKLRFNAPRLAWADGGDPPDHSVYDPVAWAKTTAASSDFRSSRLPPATATAFDSERLTNGKILRTEYGIGGDARHKVGPGWHETGSSVRKQFPPVAAGEHAPFAVPETRVGISLDRSTKAVNEGDLYAVTYVRPDLRCSLVVDFEIDGSAPPPNLATHLDKRLGCILGGRGKAAVVTIKEETVPQLQDPRAGRFWVHLVSPALIECQADIPLAGQTLPGIPELCVLAAAMPRPERFGAWDYKEKTRKWGWCIPAGASLLCEITEGATRANIVKSLDDNGLNGGLKNIFVPSACAARNSGFGEVVLAEA